MISSESCIRAMCIIKYLQQTSIRKSMAEVESQKTRITDLMETVTSRREENQRLAKAKQELEIKLANEERKASKLEVRHLHSMRM